MMAVQPESGRTPLQAVQRLATRDGAVHEEASHSAVAVAIADLLGLPLQRRRAFGAQTNAAISGAERVYLIPTDTLVAGPATDALNIAHEFHLFGGQVPFAFVATKAITHPLIGPQAVAPMGWSELFAKQVEHAVLPGWSVFSQVDARAACADLLARGPVRIKPVHGRAGRGQRVVHSVDALIAAMAQIDIDELAQCGLVLETHLEDVMTFSVGHVTVGGHSASYVGTQCLTRANDGEEVYGGSDLRVVRGGFENLLALDLSEQDRRAIEQARTYDEAAQSCYSGLVASRRNYDMVTGRDARGQEASGVLEQSWRIGGASGAELAALLALRDDPGLNEIYASTVERYGGEHRPPEDAHVVFEGDDPECGPMIKYVTIRRP